MSLLGRTLLAAVMVVVPRLAQAQEPAPEPPAPEPSLAGFHNGLFYLRDRSDVFRLYVMGRVHVDAIGWLGPGVTSLGPDSALKTTIQLRRARPEIGGEFFQDWQWLLSVDLAPTASDNPAARSASRSCTVDPSGANACADVSSPVEAALQRPGLTDAFVNYGPSPWANVQVGQYLLPFTMENRVSDNTTSFMERSLVARGLGAPNTRDLGAMFWGQAPKALVYYTAGVYTGDGPNRTNADNRFDLVGRVFTRPFVNENESLVKDAQVGLSARYGTRDPRLVGYDVNALTTQGGYVFWRPTYKDSQSRTVHILPSAQQGAIAGELFVPIDERFDFTAEAVYAVVNTREAIDGYQLSPFTERATRLTGWAYYAQVGAWVLGSREIIGNPSYGKPLHLDLDQPQKPAQRGLQVLAKVEQLHATYASRRGALDPNTPLGDIDVLSVAFGVNFWATRHLRVGLDYSFFDFPDSAPVSASARGGPVQSGAQRAVAPAQALAKGANDEARDNGHTLHEIQARVGVQF
jgi:phosphate-selective porin OprO and OprP